MKYLLVGLLLVAALPGQPAPLSTTPVRTYAAAIFTARAPVDGIETRVEIYLSLNTPSSRLGLHVDQSRRTCVAGACQEMPIFHGIALQEIGPAEAFIAPRLDRAWTHATVPIDDAVSHTTISIRVDVTWVATGPIQCDPPPDATFGIPDCMRPASALGDARTATFSLIHGQTVPDCILNASLPGY